MSLNLVSNPIFFTLPATPLQCGSVGSASGSIVYDPADGGGAGQGGGDAESAFYSLEVSSYAGGDLNDVVLDVAESRLGSLITDAVVVAGEALYMEPAVSTVLDRLAATDSVGRLDRLSRISTSVARGGELTSRKRFANDFQILRLSREGETEGSSINHYRLFHAEFFPTTFVYNFFGPEVNRELRERFVRSDITLMGGLLASLRVFIALGDLRGLSTLNYAKGVAISMEASARELDRDAKAQGDRVIVVEEATSALELLWDCLHVAQGTLDRGEFDVRTFDLCYVSLLTYVRSSRSKYPL